MKKLFSIKNEKKIPLIITFLVLGIVGVTLFHAQLLNKGPLSSTIETPKIATTTELHIIPNKVVQGEPALIKAVGVTSISNVQSFTLSGHPLAMFMYEGEVTALLGVDLRGATGTFPIVLKLKDGSELHEDFVIGLRKKVEAPFEIPEKLGGNTPESEHELITSLVSETKTINAIPIGNTKLWTEKFRSPLDGPIVVNDSYGYTRLTGQSTLSHKGVDLKAAIGTPVYAMNRGVVRFTSFLRNYGNTIVIDHGLGLQTLYLHLSKINVSPDQMVEKGDLIGLSGDTGYVLGPHLHISIRIWEISIDPIKFLDLLGEDK